MLAQHPANLLLRFVLEVMALVAVGQWGWRTGAGFSSMFTRLALTIGPPLVMAVLWGVFRAPDDMTQPNGKKPIVAVPGKVRLALELVFFGFAVWTMFASGQVLMGATAVFALLLHHAWSIQRLVKLWRGR